jgi:type I restriction enzyme S subunit
MTAETFFANFGHLADAPNGVKKLRELILQLAVQGKLVPQDKRNEPASVLLECIKVEKVRLVKERKIREGKLLPQIKQEELPFGLPTGWTWARFGDVTICRDGERIPLSRDVRSLRRGNYDYYGASGIIDKIDDYIFDKPLLLIGEDGANLINRSTPIAFIATGQYWVNNHAHVLDGISLDSLRYMELFINAIDLKSYVTGTAQPKMNQAKMNSIVVGLPPLEEQKRIVAKVDQLMSLCDELEARQKKQQQGRAHLNNAALNALLTARKPDEFADHWQRICNNVDLLYDHPDPIAKLRAAILQLAVQGKLVPQDPNDEPASVLLGRIKADTTDSTKKKRGKRDAELPAVPSDGVPYHAPKGWEWARFAHVASIASNLVKPEGYQDSVHVAPNNIEKGNGRLLPCRTVKEDEVRSSNHLFFSGQIIYSKIRPNLSKAIIVDFGGLCSADMYPINAHIVPSFLLKYILSETFLSMAVKNDTRVAMPKINQEELNKVLVPIPPLKEQKRIVAKVDQLMALCDELEAKLNQAQQHSGKLMEATVRQILVA